MLVGVSETFAFAINQNLRSCVAGAIGTGVDFVATIGGRSLNSYLVIFGYILDYIPFKSYCFCTVGLDYYIRHYILWGLTTNSDYLGTYIIVADFKRIPPNT